MATEEELKAAARKAYEAGDVGAAKRLIAAARKAGGGTAPVPQVDAMGGSIPMAEGMAALSAMSKDPAAALQGEKQRRADEQSWGEYAYDNLIGDPNNGIDSFGEGLGRGVNDVAKAGGAGAWRGATALADMALLPPNLRGKGIAQDAQEAIYSPEAINYKGKTQAGKYAGTIGEFVPGAMLTGPASLPGLMKYAVLPGMASEGAGQLTEGSKAEPYARLAASLAAPMGLSAIQSGSRAMAGLPKAAADPTRLGLARVLDDFGVPVTAGQRTGAGPLRKIEAAAGNADEVAGTQADAFTAATLKTIGVDAKRATPEVLEKASDDIGKVFDDVVGGVKVTPSAGNVTKSADVVARYKAEAPRATAIPLIGETHAAMSRAMRSGSEIAGTTLKAWRSGLSRATKSPDGATRDAAKAMLELVDDVMESGVRAAGRPADVARLAEARGQWRNLLAIEGAAARAGESAALGVISPARLASEVTRQSKSQWAKGTRGEIADLARAGVGVMSPLPTVTAGGVRSIEGLSRMGGAAAGATGGAALGSPTLAALGSVAGYAAPGMMNYLRAGPLQGMIARAGEREGTKILDKRLLNILAQGGAQ